MRASAVRTAAIKSDVSHPRVSISERIRRDIETRILAGHWPPGHRIPYEHQLMTDYDCARMTANKAIAALVAAGLVVRRRRAGSFVAEPRQERSVLEIQDFPADAARRHLPYRHAVVADAIDRLTLTESRRLGLTAGAAIRRLTCVHWIGAQAMALERRIIVLANVPSATDQSFDAIPPGSWLLRLVPWSRAEHVIRAVNADAETAQRLALSPGEACLVLDRRTWQGEALLTAVHLIHPGRRQSFSGTFSPAGFGPDR
jgi:GntR family transcriptional regulator, histidine utilization repressor